MGRRSYASASPPRCPATGEMLGEERRAGPPRAQRSQYWVARRPLTVPPVLIHQWFFSRRWMLEFRYWPRRSPDAVQSFHSLRFQPQLLVPARRLAQLQSHPRPLVLPIGPLQVAEVVDLVSGGDALIARLEEDDPPAHLGEADLLRVPAEGGARGIVAERRVGPLVVVHRRLLGEGDGVGRAGHPAGGDRRLELVAPVQETVAGADAPTVAGGAQKRPGRVLEGAGDEGSR